MTGRGFKTSALVYACCVLAAPVSAQTFEPAMAGWFSGIQRWVSGVRVEAQQTTLAQQQKANSSQAAAMAFSSVIVEQETAIKLREAVSRYESMAADTVTGLCAPASAQASANNAATTASDLRNGFADFEQQWLENGGDRLDTMVATHRIRRTALCTAGEAALGLCETASASFGVTPAGDTDAGPFLARRSYGTGEVEMGSLYIDTLAPLPSIQAADEAVSVEELIARGAARRQVALVSLARAGIGDVLLRGMQSGVEE